jgi:hypothetical protein
VIIDQQNKILTLDNSALELFATCPRKFWYRIIQHLVPKKQKLSLSFGASIHAALFEYYSGKPTKDCLKAFIEEAMKEGSKIAKYADDAAEAGQKVEYSLEFGVALMTKYIEQHPLETEDFKPMLDSDGKPMLEVGFAVELEHGLYIGKIDGIGNYRGDPGIMEHKTTGFTLSSYLKWLNPNSQITGYLKAVKDYLGLDTAKCVANIIRVKDYKRGAPEDNDQKLFMRTIVERSPQQIDSRFRQIDLQMQLIQQFLDGGIDNFYMNAPFACNAMGECVYKPLCAVKDDSDKELVQMIVDGSYKKEEWSPWDMEPKKVINADGTQDVQQIVGVEKVG